MCIRGAVKKTCIFSGHVHYKTLSKNESFSLCIKVHVFETDDFCPTKTSNILLADKGFAHLPIL